MHIKLPSNKIGGLFVVIVLIVVLVISGDVVLEKIKPLGSPELVDGDLYLERQTTSDSSVDTDSDGLLDWQEVLYKSNSQNPDTDGDGTKDGDEIKEGRDPSIVGPNDKLVKTSDLFETDFNVDYNANSLTNNLSVELLANYLNLKKSDVYNEESAQALTTDLVNNATMDVNLVDAFSASKIKTVETNKETLTKYATEFANIHNDYTSQMQTISETDDYKYVEAVSSNYKKLAQVLSMIDVPNNSLNVHVQIINKLYNTGILLDELNNYNSDPVKGLLSIKKIKENATGEEELYKSLQNYFVNNDIIFIDNEVIAFWNLYK